MTDESTVGKGKKIVVTVCVELHANWSQWILEILLLFAIWLIILFIFYLCNLLHKNYNKDLIINNILTSHLFFLWKLIASKKLFYLQNSSCLFLFV